jgi:hypothetical protein
MLLVDALVADDIAFQGSFEVALDLTHKSKDVRHQVNIVAAPETVL